MTVTDVASGSKVRRLDIQGLRAIAVLAVVAYHAAPLTLPGGFIGVDIFFVLSGYLITRIILASLDRGAFSIIDFYRRRVRRLFPALFTMLGGTLFLGVLIFPPALLIDLVESQFFTTIFVSNIYFLENTGYFDRQAALTPLLHTWSLGVEEQFYLIFPLIMIAIGRLNRALLWPLLFAFAVVSLGLSQYWSVTDPDAAFYSPISRMFELLIGALCVGVQRWVVIPEKLKDGISLVAIAILGVSFLVTSPHSFFPGMLALAPCVATGALIISVDGMGNRFLSIGPLVLVGNLSYSLYLWHWPLLVYSRFVYPNAPWADVLALSAAFGVSILSFRFIETPALRRADAPVFGKAAMVMAVSAALSWAVYLPGGFPQRFPPEAQKFLAASNDFNHDRKKCHMRSDRPIAYEQTCVYGRNGVPPGYAVWGDSHGTELAAMLGDRLARRDEALRSITMSGCPATLSRGPVCRQHVASTLSAIKDDKSMHTIVLTSNLHGHDAFATKSVLGVIDTARALRAAGKRVLIVYPLPTFDFDPPSLLAYSVRAGRDPAHVSMPRQRYDELSGHIVSRFRQLADDEAIPGIETAPLFCNESACHPYRENLGVLYYNPGHLSMLGAGVLADAILAQGLI